MRELSALEMGTFQTVRVSQESVIVQHFSTICHGQLGFLFGCFPCISNPSQRCTLVYDTAVVDNSAKYVHGLCCEKDAITEGH